MGKSLISLMSFPLPLDTVGLGDLINDRKDPRKSFFDHTTLPTKPNPSVSLSDIQNFSDMVKSTQAVDLEASLTRFASAFLRTKAKSFDELKSCLVKEYTLSNTDSWYDTIIKEDGARQWIERAKMRGKDIYLITGFRTLLDATLKSSNGTGRYGGATAHVPVGALTGNSDDGFDVKGKVEVNSTKSHITSMLVPGEKVFAMQYLKSKFRPFSSDKVDSSYLAPHNGWIEMLIVRSEEAENDGLEAELVKDVDSGDDTCDTF
ncbi:uncharacterized protein Triagg1_3932 [Trichoderma aggressivum f. europaeum]|uniref:Uncharacterized protein n=1 Tax=Trichoderma aggressivum f. europaeum TaxID=173218 RepID=A0AAE1IE95_9HYPO|nr:hypothetical protein Triagg1_3932 [Trichoderma aggressivum f. europaeum]